LINLSSRCRVVAGQTDLVSGFVIGGTAPKSVVLRGIGPGLAAFGVTDALAQPRLRLYDSQGRTLREVFGWGGDVTLATTFAGVGAFPLAANSADSALLTTLRPGAYTLQLAALSGSGSVLSEVYETANDPGSPRLLNISSRGTAGNGDAVLILGFVITGSSPKRLLIRGVGPALANFGVTAPLANPRLRVLSGTQVIAENLNWSTVPADATALSAAAIQGGAFPLASGSKDAALLATLGAGAYTAQVSSADGTSTGTALVEVYDLDP
jgi:hypothetical protein